MTTAQPAMDRTIEADVPTIAGVVAIGSLPAQIDGQERESAAGRLTVEGQAGLIDLIVLRGHLVGCVRRLRVGRRAG